MERLIGPRNSVLSLFLLKRLSEIRQKEGKYYNKRIKKIRKILF